MNSFQKHIANQNSSQTGHSLCQHVTYCTSFDPNKTCKLGNTEIINHSIICEKVNLKEVSSLPWACKKFMADLGYNPDFMTQESNSYFYNVLLCYSSIDIVFFSLMKNRFACRGESTQTILVPSHSLLSEQRYLGCSLFYDLSLPSSLSQNLRKCQVYFEKLCLI